MTTAIAPSSASASRPWLRALLYGALFMAVMGLGTITDFYSGGCMWIIPAYFMVLPIVLAIVGLRRFGVGMMVFLPYALIGPAIVYPFDWVQTQRLIGPWAALGWLPHGILVGLIGDSVFRWLGGRLSERNRAIAVGAAVGFALYLLTMLVFEILYAPQPPDSHIAFFTRGALFSLPWMVINGGFAGYTAHAIRSRA